MHMVALRLGWSIVWIGAVSAFALGYWRLEKRARQKEHDALIAHLTGWRDWRSFWQARMREEHGATT